MMQKWLEELRIELEKHFYPDEVNDILEYYEEIQQKRNCTRNDARSII